MPVYLAAADAQGDLVGNARWARNLEAGADGGDVSNDAIDSRAVELNSSGLEYALPRECTSLNHPVDLRQKFKSRVNGVSKPRLIRKRFGNRRLLRAVPARQRCNAMATAIPVR
jgi:hypothetical protein